MCPSPFLHRLACVQLFPDCTHHNNDGGISIQSWLNLWRYAAELAHIATPVVLKWHVLFFTCPVSTTCIPRACRMLLATDAPLALSALYELGYARHVRAPATLDFDPRQGVKSDSRRKSGKNVKSSVRRIFVLGSHGSGKVCSRRAGDAGHVVEPVQRSVLSAVHVFGTNDGACGVLCITHSLRAWVDLSPGLQSTLILHYILEGREGVNAHLARLEGEGEPIRPLPTLHPTHYVADVPPSRSTAVATPADAERQAALPQALVITVSGASLRP